MSIQEIIGEAIGEGSMCWSEIPKGVFESDRASKIVTQATAKLKALMLEWQKPYEDYITLLKEELDEVAPFADVHGWKSNRVKEGEEARKKITDIKQKVGLL